MDSMNYPQGVTEMLEALVSAVPRALGDNLVGIYLRGSLVTGDFIPETSDLDLLTVTERPLGDSEFGTLVSAHRELAAMSNPYARRMEIAYIDRASLKRFQPGLQHPTLGQGETLAWSEHGTNWVLERWTVREHGVVLFGPDPQALIDPISCDDLRAAVRTRLPDWVDWADQPDDPDWLLPRSHKAYVVETMCRALDTLAHCALRSKACAVSWAEGTFPEPWRSTVRRSRVWRTDSTVDPDIAPEIVSFVHWVAAEGVRLFGEEEEKT